MVLVHITGVQILPPDIKSKRRINILTDRLYNIKLVSNKEKATITGSKQDLLGLIHYILEAIHDDKSSISLKNKELTIEATE